MAPLRTDRAETLRCLVLHPFYTWTAGEEKRRQLKQELINFFNARFTFQVSILMKVQVRLDGPLLYLGGDSAFSESEGLVTGGDDLEKLWRTNTDIWTSLVDQWKKTGRLRPKSDELNINIDAPGGAFRDQRKSQRSNSDPELRGKTINLSKASGERTGKKKRIKDSGIRFFVADASRAAQEFDRRQSDHICDLLDDTDFSIAEASTRRGMTESDALFCDAKPALPEEFETAFENSRQEIMRVKNALNQEISDIREDYTDQQSVIEEDESGSIQKMAAAPIHTVTKLKSKNGDGVFSEIDAIEHVRPRDISDATTIEIRGCDTPMEDIYDE
jgi:hypothetical protein